MDRYVLPIWKKRGGKTATPKSPLVRGRSWHKILKEHLENTRKRYFKWSARDAKTLDQWVVARHDAMLHLYTKNQVRRLVNRDANCIANCFSSIAGSGQGGNCREASIFGPREEMVHGDIQQGQSCRRFERSRDPLRRRKIDLAHRRSSWWHRRNRIGDQPGSKPPIWTPRLPERLHGWRENERK